MSVDPINSEQNLFAERAKETIERKYYDEYASENDEKVANKRSDKLEVSDEAKKLQDYRTKINEGYYNKPEVIIDTAIKISEQFPKQSNTE